MFIRHFAGAVGAALIVLSTATAGPIAADHGVEGFAARAKAQERVRWHDPSRIHDPQVHIKLLGFNDFHGAISTGRLIGGRPVGSAAVLASYLKTAADNAEDGSIIVHSGDHVGASPPASALLQDEPSISF